MTEHQLYGQIARYLQVEYPEVVYRFDLAADLKLTIGQARKHKALHPTRGYPDLFIAKTSTRCIDGSWDYEWNGMFLELKKDGVNVFKKNGQLKADEHLAEQYSMLVRLREAGYYANFAIGFEDAKEQIDTYLGGGYGEIPN